MNIYYLDENPELCAQSHGDKHVVRMILETAQLLSTALYMVDTSLSASSLDGLYNPIRLNHPCTKWTAASSDNFHWLWDLGRYLCREYTYRYGRKHKLENMIYYIGDLTANMSWYKETLPRPQCMPAIYKNETDSLHAYRYYYLAEKTHLLKYTRRSVPEWITAQGLGESK